MARLDPVRGVRSRAKPSDVNVVSNIEFLNQTIASQRAALGFHVALAGGVVGLGVMAIVMIHLFAGSVISETYKVMLQLGAGFASTLSTFPLKEIFNKRDKITALIFLRREFERLQWSATLADAEQVERLEQRFWQFIDKNLGG